MDARTRILNTLRGEPVEGVPWSTYPSQVPTGTLERAFRNHGLAINCVVQLYTRETPHVEVLERQVWEQGELTIYRTYSTPVGEVHEKLRYEEGYGSRWTIEHMIRRPEDYRVVEFIVRDTRLKPNFEDIIDREQELGDDGVVMVWATRSPYRQLEIELAGLERTTFDRADGLPELASLRVALEEQHEAIYRLAAESPATFIWCPDNLTDLTVARGLFESYYVPYYNRYAAMMRQAGKILVSHFDGRLASLAGAIGRTALPVIEAFTPPPMGDLSVAQAKAAWPDKVIWANYPGSVFWQTPAEIEAFTLELLREAMPGGRFILGITENIPQVVRLRALQAMADGIAAYEREM
jgi:hypothetical protein